MTSPTHSVNRPVLAALLTAVVTAFLYLYAFRTSYSWASAHFQGGGDYRVYLKLFWALVFTFAFNQNFRRIGLRFSRPGTVAAGLVLPFVFVLASYLLVGNYLGWSGPMAVHYLCVAVAEELICNGCIILLLRPLGLVASAYVSSFIFALFHLPQIWMGCWSFDDLTDLAVIFSSGVLLAGLRLYTGSLLPGIAVHFLLDYLLVFSAPSCAVLTWGSRVPTPIEYTIWECVVQFIFLIYGMRLLLLAQKRAD